MALHPGSPCERPQGETGFRSRTRATKGQRPAHAREHRWGGGRREEEGLGQTAGVETDSPQLSHAPRCPQQPPCPLCETPAPRDPAADVRAKRAGTAAGVPIEQGRRARLSPHCCPHQRFSVISNLRAGCLRLSSIGAGFSGDEMMGDARTPSHGAKAIKNQSGGCHAGT